MARLAIVVLLTLDVAPCHSLLRSTAAQSPRQWLASSVRKPAQPRMLACTSRAEK